MASSGCVYPSKGRAVLALTCLFALLTAATVVTNADTVELLGTEKYGVVSLEIPPSVDQLNDRNFDAYVFPKNKPHRPYFIILYAPWCFHCRTILPQFLNASTLLDSEMRDYPHARFAIVNAQDNRELSSRFKVEHYPTLVYTTGKENNWYTFDGGYTMDSFAQFSVYLQRAVDSGSFADDVTDVQRFAAVEREGEGHRVPFYVFVPAGSADTPETQREAAWNVAVDAAASIGNVRFGVIYERAMSPNWRDESVGSYAQVVETATRCLNEGKNSGPGGEVMVLMSDRFRSPQCYSGPWLDTVMPAKGKGEPRVDIHPLLEQYLILNGFRAVEELNSQLFAALSQQEQNYLGLIVVDGDIRQDDVTILPAIREIVRDATEELAAQQLSAEEEMAAPKVSWAYIDGQEYLMWRQRFRVDQNELPAVVLIDTKRERLFRTRKNLPLFEAIKRDTPWSPNGQQRQLLQQFSKDVLAGEYRAEKLTSVGYLAEYVSKLPGMNRVYKLVGYEDILLLVIAFIGSFFTFLLFLGCVVEPVMEKREAAKKDKRD